VTAETALMFPEITSPGSSVLLLKVEISYFVLFLVVAYGPTRSEKYSRNEVFTVTAAVKVFGLSLTLCINCAKRGQVPSVIFVLFTFCNS
jgi:hypothetical protein